MRKVLLGALLASGAVVTGGCNSGLGAPSSPMVEAQVDYNMVVADDRAKFREQDMTYQGSVGPYAVYKITGPSPRLVGPYVKAPAGFGYAMACGATHYFSVKTAANSALAGMQLRGGHSGAMVLVDVPQMPLDQGGCTTPKDTFGNPVPDGGTGGAGGTGGGGEGGTGGGGEGGGGGGTVGGSPGGGTGTTGGGPIGDNGPPGGLGGGATPGDGSGGDTGVQQIGLTVSPPPPMGSTILVRRVALTAAQSHNGSHIEPNICCTDNVCSLQ